MRQLTGLLKTLSTKNLQMTSCPFLTWNPWLPNAYTKSGRQNGMNLLEYPISFMRFHQRSWKIIILLWYKRKRHRSKQITHLSHLSDKLLYFEKRRASCLFCIDTITPIKHILIECADLVEVTKKTKTKNLRRDLWIYFFNMSTQQQLLTSWQQLVYSVREEVM